MNVVVVDVAAQEVVEAISKVEVEDVVEENTEEEVEDEVIEAIEVLHGAGLIVLLRD